MPDACAIGGCVKGYVQPAHTASAVGEVAAENIFNQEAHYANPTCVYMEPEAASMGLTEEVCKAQGFSYKMGKFPLTANGKSLILNGDEDLVKIIAGGEHREILGMHIVGARATDLIGRGARWMRSSLPFTLMPPSRSQSARRPPRWKKEPSISKTDLSVRNTCCTGPMSPRAAGKQKNRPLFSANSPRQRRADWRDGTPRGHQPVRKVRKNIWRRSPGQAERVSLASYGEARTQHGIER